MVRTVRSVKKCGGTIFPEGYYISANRTSTVFRITNENILFFVKPNPVAKIGPAL